MKQDIKNKLSAALVSGEYTQGHGALRINDTYCMMGVLCDLYRKDTGCGEWVPDVIPGGEHKYYSFRDAFGEENAAFPPDGVALWADLCDGEWMTLLLWNDRTRYPFVDIAQKIQTEL